MENKKTLFSGFTLFQVSLGRRGLRMPFQIFENEASNPGVCPAISFHLDWMLIVEEIVA